MFEPYLGETLVNCAKSHGPTHKSVSKSFVSNGDYLFNAQFFELKKYTDYN